MMIGSQVFICWQLVYWVCCKINELCIVVSVELVQYCVVIRVFIEVCFNGDLDILFEVLDLGVVGEIDVCKGVVVVGVDWVGLIILCYWSYFVIVLVVQLVCG